MAKTAERQDEVEVLRRRVADLETMNAQQAEHLQSLNDTLDTFKTRFIEEFNAHTQTSGALRAAQRKLSNLESVLASQAAQNESIPVTN